MRYIILFLKGIVMGASDLIPGISGGTIALITGIYKELLESINALSWKNLKNFNIKKILIFWKEIKGPFLFPLVGGIIISILFFSRYIEFLLIEETIGTWSFFFGLLSSSIIFLIQRELKFNFSSLLCLSLGAITSYFISLLSVFSNNIPLWYIFLSGFIGISAMILPGLSGAYILLIMGVYQTILTNIRLAQDLIYKFNDEQFYNVASILGVFLLGILIGIKVFSRFLTWLLKLYPNNTIAFLIGSMLGSIHKIWPWQNKSIEKKILNFEQTFPVLPQNYEGQDSQLIKGITLMLLGFIILFFLEKTKSLFKDERYF